MDQISIDVTPDPDPDPAKQGDYIVSASGSVTRLTTSDDRALFKLDDDIVKKAIDSLRGKEPDDVLYNDPTQWGNVFHKYKWAELQVQLFPISAVVSNFTLNNAVLGETEVKNDDSEETILVNIGFQVTKENSVEMNWSETSTLSVSQEVHYGMKFFGGSTTLSYSKAWQSGGSETETVTLGSSVSAEIPLGPNEKGKAKLNGKIGTALITITYRARLIGGVFSNYGKKHDGHHFYYNGISSILNTEGLSNDITMVEQMYATAYVYVNTVFDIEGGETRVVHVNPHVIQDAQNPEEEMAPA